MQSPFLKKILSEVFEEYPGITSELERLEFNAPFECFVHRWNKLTAARDELRREQEEVLNEANDVEDASRHFELLYDTLRGELESTLREKQDLLKHGVMKFHSVWTIFEPGCLVYHKNEEQDRVYKLKTAKVEASNGTKMYKLECDSVDFDGEKFGHMAEFVYIKAFTGTKTITKLEGYPLVFHENSAELRHRLVERGRRFEAYQGYHFVGYEGIAHGKAHRGETKYNVNSRIIIDAYAHARYNNKITLQLFETKPDSEEHVSTRIDEDTDDDTVMVGK